MKLVLLVLLSVFADTALAASKIRADIPEAITAWTRFSECASLLDRTAEYNRCLKSAMSESATPFDQTKATGFLMLELPIKLLGPCPIELESTQLQRAEKKPSSRFACFEIELKSSRMGGEIQFTVDSKNKLRVYRIRYM